MIIRRATPADLEAMTWVLIGASPLDPVYPYRFPDRHLYPGEFAALCRRKCAEYLATSTVVVCEMPIDDFGSATQVVAFSAWDMPEPDARRPMRSSAVSGAVGTCHDVISPHESLQTPPKFHHSKILESLTRALFQNRHPSPQLRSPRQPSAP